MNMLGEIVERETGAPTPPSAPKPRELPGKLQKKWRTRRGFPKPPPAAPVSQASQAPPSKMGGQEDDENTRRVKNMTSTEIEEARSEIAGLDPALLEMLRQRGLKKQQTQGSTDGPAASGSLVTDSHSASSGIGGHRSGTVSTDPHHNHEHTHNHNHDAPHDHGHNHDHHDHHHHSGNIDEDDALRHPPVEPTNPAEFEAAVKTVHFPPPPEDLRDYFPDLPIETDKLAWMQPMSETEENEYSESMVSITPSELRFDFHGNLITPRQSRLIPPSAGLHHHGDAPSAAGYTLPELAHLARSSHSQQRALAIQTAGRVLHKLKRGRFAKSSDLQEGLRDLVHVTRIVDTLTEAASERTRSVTVRRVATEALWLANAS